MTTAKPDPWTEHGKPVTRTFAKVTIADQVDPKSRTGTPAGYTTIAVSPAGWRDPELARLLAGGSVTRAWVVNWVNGYPVREPSTDRVCRHCWRPIFLCSDFTWDLHYREYEHTRQCDARSDGASLSELPHEPWSGEEGN